MIKVAHVKMLHSRQNRLPNPNPFSAIPVDGLLMALIIWKHSTAWQVKLTWLFCLVLVVSEIVLPCCGGPFSIDYY